MSSDAYNAGFRAGLSAYAGKILSVVPISDTLEAGQTTGTLVNYLKTAISERAILKQQVEDLRKQLREQTQ